MKITEDKPRLRITRQRKVILEGLKNSTSHPTACEVYDMVRRELPRVSLGTVYRNLETLSRDGHILKLDLDDEGQKRFDGRTDTHYHLRCLDCGRVLDIDLPVQIDIENKANRLTDCRITGHKLEFIGLCPGCSGAVGQRDERLKGRKTMDEESIRHPDQENIRGLSRVKKGGSKDG